MSEAQPVARSLPKRDLWLLPLIAFLTLILMAGGSELAARLVWPEHEVTPCLHTNTSGDVVAIPHCVSHVKTAEGPWLTNLYNECGLRATGPCQGFDPRNTRIVVLGSSTSWGYMVPFEQVWSTRLAQRLSRRCGGTPVDVQAFPGFADINGNARRIDAALQLRPDMIIMVITPLDLESISARGFVPPRPGQMVAKVEDKPESFIGWLRNAVSESRAAKIAEHFLYRNPNTYVPAFLTNGDKADFLRTPLSRRWRQRVQAVDDGLHYFQAHLRGVPMMILFAPQQAQAQLISEDQMHVANVDPTALPRALSQVAHENGVLFADASDQFEQINAAEDMFYNADGHLNGAGHDLLARAAEDTIHSAYGQRALCPTTTDVGP